MRRSPQGGETGFLLPYLGTEATIYPRNLVSSPAVWGDRLVARGQDLVSPTRNELVAIVV